MSRSTVVSESSMVTQPQNPRVLIFSQRNIFKKRLFFAALIMNSRIRSAKLTRQRSWRRRRIHLIHATESPGEPLFMCLLL